MSGGFPASPELCSTAATFATWDGATLTSSLAGTVPAYGSWTQLVASLANDVNELIVHLAGGLGQSAVNIGIGASGSEIILIPNIVYNNTAITSLVIPVALPARTRIAVQSAMKTSANSTSVGLTYSTAQSFVASEVYAFDSVGFSATNVAGTPVLSGAAGVFGSYTQLVAASANDYAGFIAMVDSQNGSFSAADNGKFKIAIGALGSEIDLMSAIAVQGYKQPGETAFGHAQPYYYPIPAGTRISAAFEDTAGAATIGICLIGIRK